MNKTFRIRNPRENEFATIWPVGPDLYTVLWDEDELSCRYKKSMVEMHLANNTWEIVSDVVGDSLPITFKFYCQDEPTRIYTYNQLPGQAKKIKVTWVDENCIEQSYNGYDIESVKKYVTKGEWIVLPSKIEQDKSTFTITLDTTEATKQLEEFLVLAKNVEDAVKKLRSVLGVETFTLDLEGLV